MFIVIIYDWICIAEHTHRSQHIIYPHLLSFSLNHQPQHDRIYFNCLVNVLKCLNFTHLVCTACNNNCNYHSLSLCNCPGTNKSPIPAHLHTKTAYFHITSSLLLHHNNDIVSSADIISIDWTYLLFLSILLPLHLLDNLWMERRHYHDETLAQPSGLIPILLSSSL